MPTTNNYSYHINHQTSIMKKITFLALSTLLLASCSDDNAPQAPAGNGAISLSISGPVVLSRTSTSETDGVIKTSFVAGDEIGVSATGGAIAANVKHTVAADGSKLDPEQPIEIQYNVAAQLQAYSPYTAEATADGVTFNVKADQSADADFNASNFMTAKASVTKENPAASLTFTPRTALIYVEMAGALGENAESLTLCGMQSGLSWKSATDAVATQGDAADVKMYKVAGSQVFMAFVPAQSSIAGQPLFAITIGSNEYTYTPTGTIEFKANTVKRFKLTVNADATVNIESSVVSGSDWTEDGTDTENGEGEITRRYVELISAAEGDFTGKELATATGMQGAQAGWNAILNNSNSSTITISGDEAVIATDGGSWYQRALYFRAPNGKGTAHKYVLEFDVKGGTDIQVAVMRGQQAGAFTSNAYFEVGGATAAKVERTEAEYTHKSLQVDLSKISTGDVDFSTGIGVIFFAKDNAAQTHSIKNVSLIEIE